MVYLVTVLNHVTWLAIAHKVVLLCLTLISFELYLYVY
jgi:hypothetical protein